MNDRIIERFERILNAELTAINKGTSTLSVPVQRALPVVSSTILDMLHETHNPSYITEEITHAMNYVRYNRLVDHDMYSDIDKQLFAYDLDDIPLLIPATIKSLVMQLLNMLGIQPPPQLRNVLIELVDYKNKRQQYGSSYMFRHKT